MVCWQLQTGGDRPFRSGRIAIEVDVSSNESGGETFRRIFDDRVLTTTLRTVPSSNIIREQFGLLTLTYEQRTEASQRVLVQRSAHFFGVRLPRWVLQVRAIVEAGEQVEHTAPIRSHVEIEIMSRWTVTYDAFLHPVRNDQTSNYSQTRTAQ